jgi:small redox-active disulfide protein 2
VKEAMMTIQIRVLGPGCIRCKTLFENTEEAVARLGLDARVEKVEDVGEMASRGILTSPALVVNDELLLAGHVATPRAIEQLLAAWVQTDTSAPDERNEPGTIRPRTPSAAAT